MGKGNRENQKKSGSGKGLGLVGGLFAAKLIFVILIIIFVVIVLFFIRRGANPDAVKFEHIHGLGYTNEGALYLAAHKGLVIYSHRDWAKPDIQKNDYMGFSMVDDGFYSSGHPGEGANIANPMGLVKVSDGGKKVHALALTGEVDFHVMAAGYYSHAIYVFNPKKNSKMPETGLHYSLDDGKTWTKSAAKGLKGQAKAIAVNPQKKNVVAVGTEQGLFFSEDNGQTFKNILPGENVTCLTFGFENKLLAGAFTGESTLITVDPHQSGSKLQIELSSIEQDPLTSIAQNPNDANQLVIATKKGDMFFTPNSGQNWTILAKQGKGLSGK